MIATWIKFAWLNVLRNRRRSAVTITVTALGVGAILVSGGFALFTYEGLAQAAARNTGHLIVAKPEQFSSDEDTPLQHGLDDMDSYRSALLADSAVRHVLPRVEFAGLVSNGDKSAVMVAAGIDPDSEFAVKGPFLTVSAGQVLTSGQPLQVMLGKGLARSMKAEPGSSLTLLASTTDGALNALDVTVAGVFSTGVPEIDKRLVYTDLSTAQKLLATKRVSSLGVFLSSMNETLPAQERVKAALPKLAVQTWVDQAAFYKSVRQLYNRIFGAMGLIIGAIVVFVVTNAMAMAIIERTRETGTLRAIGTLPSQLVANFAMEGLILGGIGSVLGAALSLGISVALLIFPVTMPPPPGRTSGYPLQISIDPNLYGVTLLVILALATVASALVARRTVNRSIVYALAHV